MITIKWSDYRTKILTTVDNQAFYVAELERLNLNFSRHGNEIKSRCPFTHLHAGGTDLNPSFTVNLDRGVYFCNACGSKGNIHTFYTEIYGVTKQEAWYTLGDALDLQRPKDTDSRPGIDPALPAKWHKTLMASTEVIRDILKDKRGITDATLKEYQIGWDGDRVTIPIYDEFSELVNIRRYKWNSYEDNIKMINYKDEQDNAYGEVRIYGMEHLVDDSVKELVWCEGEWDRLVAEQNGIKTCTATAGVNNFRTEWLKLLGTKERVYIAYDNDDAGRMATTYLVENLRNETELYVIKWPEDFKDKGDITDIFIEDGINKEDFMKLFEPVDKVEEAKEVQLSTSSNAKYAGKRIKIPVLLAGKESAPYVYPRNVRMSCQDGDEDKKMCASCILLYKKRVDIQLNSSEALMLKLIDVPDTTQIATLKGASGCNPKCPLAKYEVLEHGNLETIHMIPKADPSFNFSLRQEYVARSGYLMGSNIPTNKRYTMIGYMHADPRTQKATYIFDSVVPEKDMLDELEITPELHEMLKVFQCAEGQTVSEKFKEIHDDLERNVTYIWERQEVAYAVDLIYHTALSFHFQEQFVKRGWGECLIIGDSGQAKTTLVERLMNHYKSGELLSGESAKRTGLVYNMQQTGSKGQWSLMWGAMPLNDGGLLTIDELSGMHENDLAQLSDVRSSGIAKATGVVTGETTSRTRIIFISNPRSGRQLKAENYGVTSILKLFGKAEDVRRLDFAVAVTSGEVDANIVNKSISEMPVVPHVYDTDLCRTRVMWAWSRKPEQIVFTDEATERILELAAEMGKRYSSRIPLVEPADQRLKIARLAIAAAVCVYSTDDGNNIIVKPEHAEFVVDYLYTVYNNRSLGYDRFSADDFETSNTADGAMRRIRNSFLMLPIVNREIMEIIRAIYQMPYFDRNTLEDATGLDRDELRDLMQFLISNTIIEKTAYDYKRTPLGLAFIEHMLLDPPTEHEIVEARKKGFTENKI